MVGWLIGNIPIMSKGSGTVTPSRDQQCEHRMRWDMLPPLCRPDDIEAKNAEVRRRAEEPETVKTEAEEARRFEDRAGSPERWEPN